MRFSRVTGSLRSDSVGGGGSQGLTHLEPLPSPMSSTPMRQCLSALHCRPPSFLRPTSIFLTDPLALVLVDKHGSQSCCPECAGNNNSEDLDEIYEVEPNRVLGSLKSNCWNNKYFKASKKNGVDKSVVFCRLCTEVGKGDEGIKYSGSTTNLHNHDSRHHNDNSSASETSQTRSSELFGFVRNSGKKWSKNSIQWKKMTDAITKWIIKDSRPTSIVEDEGLKTVFEMMCPEYEVPCRKTITNYMEKMYKKKHKDVCEELSGIDWFAYTGDGGSSINRMSLQVNQVHYINDDFELKSKTLGMRENKDDHSAENFRMRSDDDLEEFGVPESKICQWVTDNENKMLAAFPENRSGCLAHLINSNVEEGMKNDVANEVTQKLKDIATLHNTSSKFRYEVECQQIEMGLKPKRIQQAVCNRWGSMKSSIESALPSGEDYSDDYFEAIDRALNALAAKTKKKDQRKRVKELVLSRAEMTRLKALHKLLKGYDVSITVLGTSKVSGSLVFPILETIKTCVLKEDSDDPTFIQEMKRKMKTDLSDRIAKYVNTTVLRNASALDPREKKLKFMPSKATRKVVQDRILAELKSVRLSEQDPVSESHQLSAGLDSSDEEIEEPASKRKRNHFGIMYQDSDDDEDSPTISVEDEWKMFLDEPQCDYDIDPLQWYKERQQKYPTIVKLARSVRHQMIHCFKIIDSRFYRKYLTIPATSTESERAFSAMGVLLTKKRLSMLPSHVDMQMFLKDCL